MTFTVRCLLSPRGGAQRGEIRERALFIRQARFRAKLLRWLAGQNSNENAVKSTRYLQNLFLENIHRDFDLAKLM